MDLTTKGFQLPDSINFESESLTDTYGKFSAEAFERGFGTTIGNALRRVLLSSIDGAAVTSIRIPGALHEFTAIPNVKEDVVDVVLNVKQLRFKSHSDDPQVITVDVKGPGVVSGKDISGSQIEVLNPDQHIATLEKKVNLAMELTIAKGKGYVPAENNKDEDQPVDTIAIDSIFTPIRKVNFWVEGARVGRSTDYDKLVMEIWTDGSITPQAALSEAANVLKEHLALFCVENGGSVEEEVVEAASDDPENNIGIMTDFMDEEPVELNENLLKSVEELELSVRSYNCLKNANIRTLADLVQRTEQEMLRTKNFGRKSLNEIKEIIVAMGLHFNMRVEPEDLERLSAAKRPENAT
jgi:DNA-directed RNA polymerase subunit alpha